jgi:lipopolysaccharide biosynthesis regulator YciM
MEIFMFLFWALVILGVIYFGWKFYSHFRARKREVYSPYIDALNLIIAGEKVRAVEKLREAVHLDTNNIDAYIKLGNLLRELNRLDSAIKIHQNLTFRANLKSFQRLEIFKSLAVDYHKSGNIDKSLEMLDKVIAIDEENLWALEEKLVIYETKKEWENAFETLEKILKLKKKDKDARLGFYKVYQGLDLHGKNEGKEARIKFKEAMKSDENCQPAYMYLGDSYIKEDRKEEAVEVWKEFIEKFPSESYKVFDRMEKVLFEIGKFDEIENVYSSILEKDPDNMIAILALADIYDKKGETKNAINLCQSVLEKHPESLFARRFLVKMYHKAGNTKQALNYALELANQLYSEIYRCKSCGFKSKEPLWLCPQCHKWDSFQYE